jgi:hypothetical protein
VHELLDHFYLSYFQSEHALSPSPHAQGWRQQQAAHDPLPYQRISLDTGRFVQAWVAAFTAPAPGLRLLVLWVREVVWSGFIAAECGPLLGWLLSPDTGRISDGIVNQVKAKDQVGWVSSCRALVCVLDMAWRETHSLGITTNAHSR